MCSKKMRCGEEFSGLAVQDRRPPTAPGGELGAVTDPPPATDLKAKTTHSAKFASCRKIRASTLIEVIISSVIFLVIFTISLETITRLTMQQPDVESFVESDYQIKSAFREYGDGRHEAGKYVVTYDWGRIEVRIVPYKEYSDLQHITITAEIKNSGKRREFNHLIERHDE